MHVTAGETTAPRRQVSWHGAAHAVNARSWGTKPTTGLCVRRAWCEDVLGTLGLAHAADVVAQAVFARQLARAREMVDLQHTAQPVTRTPSGSARRWYSVHTHTWGQPHVVQRRAARPVALAPAGADIGRPGPPRRSRRANLGRTTREHVWCVWPTF